MDTLMATAGTAHTPTIMTTDMHYLWHMAGAVYITDGTLIECCGSGWTDVYMYEEGDGASYCYVESRILDTEVYMYGYVY